MEYKIGDVADILNISKEMIRYYEKQGVLKTIRKDNNYRVYSSIDIILLLEMLHYQSIGFTIKETVTLLNDNFANNYQHKLETYYNELIEEVTYKSLLINHIKEIRNRIKTCQMNLGKYWFKNIPSYQLSFICNEFNDAYDQIHLDDDSKTILFDKGYLSFCDSIVLFEEDKNTWWYGIKSEYIEPLQINPQNTRELKNNICLCTCIDIGEIGDFNCNALNEVKQYIKDQHLIVNGTIRGIVIYRGFQNGKYQRILEIQVPIKL